MIVQWPEYTARGEEAGSLCHLESTFLQEIAQEVGAKLLQKPLRLRFEQSTLKAAFPARHFKS